MRIETGPAPRDAELGSPSQGWARYVRRVEEISTGVLFLAMFCTIVVGVAFRLLLNTPLVWTVAASTIAFIGVVTIGSLPLVREDEHISFDIVYLLLPEPARLAARLVSDVLIIVPFAIAIVPTARYLAFMHDELVPGVGIPFSIAYSPFLIFLVGVVLHRSARALGEVRRLVAGRRSER